MNSVDIAFGFLAAIGVIGFTVAWFALTPSDAKDRLRAIQLELSLKVAQMETMAVAMEKMEKEIERSRQKPVKA